MNTWPVEIHSQYPPRAWLTESRDRWEASFGRVPFQGETGGEQGVLGERAADQLHSERQSGGREPGGELQRGEAGDVRGYAEAPQTISFGRCS